jgi:hypothetical protein
VEEDPATAEGRDQAGDSRAFKPALIWRFTWRPRAMVVATSIAVSPPRIPRTMGTYFFLASHSDLELDSLIRKGRLGIPVEEVLRAPFG